MRRAILQSFLLAGGIFSLAFFVPQISEGQAVFEPSAPQEVTITAGDKEALIKFSTPLDDGGSAITGYVIMKTPVPLETRKISPTETSYLWTGLTNGKDYEFSVAAENAEGIGPYAPTTPKEVRPNESAKAFVESAEVLFDPKAESVTVRGKVINVRDSESRNRIEFLYAPFDDADRDPSADPDDEYYLKPKGGFRFTDGDNFSFTLNDLKPGTMYKFRLGYTDIENGEVDLDIGNFRTRDAETEETGVSTGGTTTGGREQDPSAVKNATIRVKLDNPLGDTDSLPALLGKILDAAVIILTPLVVLMLVYSGFLFVKAQGNPEGLGEAKKTLMYVLIGAAIVLCAKGLSIFVQSTITCLGGSPDC